MVINQNGDISGLSVDKIPDRYYTGNAIKPTICSKKVALSSEDYFTLNGNPNLKQITTVYGGNILSSLSYLYVKNPKAPDGATSLVKNIYAPYDFVSVPDDNYFVFNFDPIAVEQAGTYNVSI